MTLAGLGLVLLAADLPAQSPSDLERRVLQETNLARTNPAGYADHLEEMLSWFRDDVIYRPGSSIGIRTEEGPDAFREAIAFLRRVEPVPALTWSNGLWRAARAHARDIGRTGATDHEGSDGSHMVDRLNRYGEWQETAAENIDFGNDDPRRVVISLIVDDGVRNRGHRTNIFNAALRVAGVGCGPHTEYRYVCVVDYAGGYEERE